MEDDRELPGLRLEDYLLLGAVFLLPWIFGGVEIFAYRGASLLLVSAAAVALTRRGFRGWYLDRAPRRWLVPALLLGVWGAFQLAPLPAGLISILSPKAHEIYEQTLPGYGTNDGVEETLVALEQWGLERIETEIPPPSVPDPRLAVEDSGCSRDLRQLSVQPNATAERLAWYVALLLGFLTLCQRLRSPARFKIYLSAVAFLFASLAAIGTAQHFYWNEHLLWLRPFQVEGRPFGPYVNANHFSGLMDLGVPVLLGLALHRMSRSGRDWARNRYSLAALSGVGICLLATILAASKASAILVGASVAAMVLILAQGRARLMALCGVTLALAAAIFAFGFTELGQRFEDQLADIPETGYFGPRTLIWSNATEMLRDFPIAGSGFGTFREVYPEYAAGHHRRFAQAHSDLLEVTLDGGLVAGALVLWLLLGYFSSCLTGSRRWTGTRLGLLVGVAALSLHALVDFNHQIPGNALSFVAVAAMLVADGDPEEAA